MTRLWPGRDGLDSPDVEDPPPLQAWHDWMDLCAARERDEPAPLDVLRRLVGNVDAWTLWWDRPHRGGDRLTHRAAVVRHTLVSACGYSKPYFAVEYGIWPVGDRAIRDSRRTYCQHCDADAPPVLHGPR